MGLLPSFYLVQLALAPLPPFAANALAEIEVETSIDGAGMFRLHFDLSRNFVGDFDAIMFDLFRPLVPIRISMSFGLGAPLTLINGYVRDVQLSVGNEPGSSRMEVVGGDALGTIMGQWQAPADWGNVPDSAIVAAIFSRYAVLPAVTPTPLTRTILQKTKTQQVRDNAFVRDIATFHGYYLFIQPALVVGNDVGWFLPVSKMLSFPPQGVLSIDFGIETNLHSFQVSNQMLKPKSLVATCIEEDTRAPVVVIAPTAMEMPMGLEPSHSRVVPPPIEVDISDRPANPAEKYLNALANVTESGRSIQASGQVDGLKIARPLIPGVPVMVRGAGRQYSGAYLVTSVSHRISRDGYVQSFQALRNAIGLTGAEIFVDPLAPVT
ncbi:MAG: hypothetical protein M3Q19_06360 [Pseudomonadota bacterium]|nr:hypothetical protein [Pseudomonadota bacterium]